MLAANFAEFPGDLSRFDDESLRKMGFLDLVRHLEAESAQREPFKTLDVALTGFCGPQVKRNLYRWLCLAHYQSALRQAEIQSLKQKLAQLYGKQWELMDRSSEGTFGFLLKALAGGKHLSDPQLWEEVERHRQAWRNGEAKKIAKETEERERLRKRSGIAPRRSGSIDWTKPHTAQEYVDAFADARINVKRLREFLRPLSNTGKRRGRGHNNPIEYPFQTGLALMQKAVTEWIRDDRKRAMWLTATVTYQVTQPSALTPEGLRFRQVAALLCKRFWSGALKSIWPEGGGLRLVETEEAWRIWHTALQANGLISVPDFLKTASIPR